MQAPNPYDLTQYLLYRDANVLVLNKPAGLPVHRGPKGGPNLTDLLEQLRFGLPRNPELAHRLDKDTSGCLVLGRHLKALQQLSQWFSTGKVDKLYWAMTKGGPLENQGEINLPLAPRDPKRGWWMKVDPQGQPSLTRYQVLGRSTDHAWLALEPVTGRTHQLRVHCAESGFPIANDPIYGHGPRFGGDGLMLHARSISLPLKKNAERVTILAPLRPEMVIALRTCGYNPESDPQINP